MTTTPRVSRREREILDLAFECGQVTVRDLCERLPDAPSDGAVRTMLARLETKGLLRRSSTDGRIAYRPTMARQTARRSALSRLVRTFFGGSVEQTVQALLEQPESLEDEELDRLAALIEKAKEEKAR